jgi:hypothetical protein
MIATTTACRGVPG